MAPLPPNLEYSLRLMTLPARPDRMMVIPLLHNKMTRLGRNNVSATDPEITTYLLNMEEYSYNRDLISRTHCELWFDKNTGKLMIRDGGRSAETGVYKPSVNGTSVQGILLPFEGETELREGYTIELGAPHLCPGRRDDTPQPNEFVYRVEAEEPIGFNAPNPKKRRKVKSEPEVKREEKVKSKPKPKPKPKPTVDEDPPTLRPETRSLRKRKAEA